MRILVTGANGFIGSHLVKILLDNGHEVVGVDLDDTISELLKEKIRNNLSLFSYFNLDISVKSDLLRHLMSNVQTIYHFAAVVGIPNYLEQPLRLFEVNVIGSKNLIDLAIDNGVKFIFASTSEIYGKNPNVPWREDDDRILGSTAINRWNYSSSKATVEHLLFAAKKELDFTILRYFNVYGPGQNPIFLVSRNIKRAVNGKSIVIYDGGNQTRCLTYINDAIEATVIVGQAKIHKYDVYNIGNTSELTVNSIANLVRENFPDVKFENYDISKVNSRNYEDLLRRVPDTLRIQSEFQWKPSTDVPSGIKAFSDWAKENSWWRER